MAEKPDGPDPDTPTASVQAPARETRPAGEPPGPELLPTGARVGRYVVLGRLGAGGMGVVYAGFDPELDRKIALKILLPEAGAASGSSAQLWLLREAQALAQLSHPNVVAVHDVGTFSERVFMAMEFVEGTTLKDWLAQAPRPWREVVGVFLAAGEGLAAAHAKGLVHRDFKPSNVLIGKDGRVRVLDFGLARHEAGEPEVRPAFRPELTPSPLLDTPLTRAGVVVGTPAYLPPEAREGRPGDARGDQFSFCVSLYEALYGTRPWSSERGASRPPERPKGSPVPARVHALLLRGLARRPEDRFPSMDELLEDLRRQAAPRKRAWALGALLVTLAAAGIALPLRPRKPELCTGAQALLGGVWDAQRSAQLKTAFAPAVSPRAQEAWDITRAALDAYSRAWVGMHTEACRATRVRGEQSDEVLSLRMACLDQRLGELKALVDVLSEGGAGLVDRSTRAVQGLTPLQLCANVAALRAPVPPPRDPATQARIEALRPSLAKGKALLDAAKYQDGLALIGPVAQEATALHYRPLEAEAYDLLGVLQEKAGQFPAAESSFLTSAQAALAGGHKRLLALAAARLVREALLENKKDLSKTWEPLGRSALEALGGDPLVEAYLDMAMGASRVEHAPAEALPYIQRALELRQGALGPEHADVAAAYNNLGAAQVELGQGQAALDNLKHALSVWSATLGSMHPETANAMQNIAWQLEEQGKLKEAYELAKSCLKAREAALGPKHPVIADTLAVLATIVKEEGTGDLGLSLLDRALSISREVRGEAHVQTIILHDRRALTLSELHRPAEALHEHELALKALAAGPGLEDEEVVYLWRGAAEDLRALHRYPEALTYYQKLERYISAHPALPRHNLVGYLESYGEYLQEVKHPLEALGYEERALAAATSFYGEDAPELMGTLTALAHAAAAAGRPLDAVKYLEQSLSIGERHHMSAGVLADARFELAEALSGAKEAPARTRALGEQAMADFTTAGRTADAEKVARWLDKHPPTSGAPARAAGQPTAPPDPP